ncbi:uncharacterized protein LOC123475973 [Daphnia magna]|uniref:uncharacterized protein LOC123475973 n=1 Tax=Daphnia magna TaxID=35525 RepID=UPI001E1BA253|nr:uncharacterized protein LOC123475973 [Daphnia magna]
MAVLDQLAESQTQVVSAPMTTTMVNRPALPLPMFNGEIAAWGSWKAALATYHDEVTLLEEQKYQYLRGCFKGKATDVVSYLPYGTNQYRKVIEVLRDRFGDEDKLKKYYLAELKAIANTRMSKTSVLPQGQKLYDGLTNTVAALASLGVNTKTHEAYLTPDLLASLPKALVSRSRDRWDDAEPTFAKILQALKREIRFREEDEALSMSCSGKPMPESAATTSNNGITNQ